jgi:hypothetical protein
MVVTADMKRSLKRVCARLALPGLLETERRTFWAVHRKTLRAIDKDIAARRKQYANAPGRHMNELEWQIVQGYCSQYVWNYLITRREDVGIDNVRPLVPGSVVDLALCEAGPLIQKLYERP